MQRMRTILVGMGHMGRHHFRILQEDPRFELLAVVDPVLPALPEDQARSGSGAQALPLLREIEMAWSLPFDLAVIAAPTELHGRLVSAVLERGRHVFVEKPAASTSQEARQLVALAAAKGVCLAVGNIERCNPVVRALRELLARQELGELIHVTGTRAGAYPAHIKAGNNVFLDLAVHELDVFRMLLGPLTLRYAVGHAKKQAEAGIWDLGQISLLSRSGVSGTIDIDWFSPQRRRSIRVIGTEAQAQVNYIEQSLEVIGADGQLRSLPVAKVETLKVQLDQLHRYLSGESHQLATGAELIESVALVEEAQRLAAQSGA